METLRVPAQFYDGSSSIPHKRILVIKKDASLEILDESSHSIKRINSDQYQWELPVGKAPMKFRLSDGTLIETGYHEEIKQLLLTRKECFTNNLFNLETNLKATLSLFLGACGVVLVLYFFAVPLSAKALQPFIPISMKESIGKQGLYMLDKIMFSPSEVDIEHQKKLKKQALELATMAEFPLELEVHFRTLKGHLPNAFALPPRHIIVTDELVSLLDQEEFLAIIGHELGHLSHDHVTESLLRASIVSVVTFMLLGSNPEVLESMAIGIFDASYSQNHESEADTYGVQLLQKTKKDPTKLADALRKLQDKYGEESKLSTYFSSHPLTSDRIRAIYKLASRPEANKKTLTQ
jgi:Zn-dependent protease with chaperone function